MVEQGIADYVGLGTVYKTNTKDVTDPEGTGPSGIRRMLRVLQNTIRNQALRKFKALQLVE